MKKILYKILFTSSERFLIFNALACRSETDFYQNSDSQNKDLRSNAKKLIIKISKL